MFFLFCMILRPPRSTRTDTLFPYTTLFRSFHLREGVRFHNGAPLTAAAVVWSLNRYLAPDSRWRCKADLSHGGVAPVESVRADGRDMVEVRLEQAAPLFLAELARLDCRSEERRIGKGSVSVCRYRWAAET